MTTFSIEIPPPSVFRPSRASYRPLPAGTDLQHLLPEREPRRWPQPTVGLRPPSAWGHRPSRLTLAANLPVAHQDRVGIAEELLRPALGGANRVPMRTARLRVGTLIRVVAFEDGSALRQAVLDALITR